MAWVATNKIPSTAAASKATPTPIGRGVHRNVALSMYSDMPSGEISLEEFERYALDRLKGVSVDPFFCLKSKVESLSHCLLA